MLIYFKYANGGHDRVKNQFANASRIVSNIFKY